MLITLRERDGLEGSARIWRALGPGDSRGIPGRARSDVEGCAAPGLRRQRPGWRCAERRGPNIRILHLQITAPCMNHAHARTHAHVNTHVKTCTHTHTKRVLTRAHTNKRVHVALSLCCEILTKETLPIAYTDAKMCVCRTTHALQLCIFVVASGARARPNLEAHPDDRRDPEKNPEVPLCFPTSNCFLNIYKYQTICHSSGVNSAEEKRAVVIGCWQTSFDKPEN